MTPARWQDGRPGQDLSSVASDATRCRGDARCTGAAPSERSRLAPAPLRYPLTVYYDASCPLCTAETHALKACDRDGRLQLVDCSAQPFEDAHAHAAGIAQDVLLRVIHARDADGVWLRGVPVFEAMYRIAGLEAIARLWAHPLLRPLWDRGYPWVARNRIVLSRLGLTHAFGWLARRSARRSAAMRCDDGLCTPLPDAMGDRRGHPPKRATSRLPPP